MGRVSVGGAAVRSNASNAGRGEHCEVAHRARRGAEGEVEGRAMRVCVCGEREGRRGRCGVRCHCEARICCAVVVEEEEEGLNVKSSASWETGQKQRERWARAGSCACGT
jgi:hypothetical protein